MTWNGNIGLHGAELPSAEAREYMTGSDRAADPLAGRRTALAAGRALCVIALLFASGDVWPVFKVGFTFRLAQFCVFAAVILLLSALDRPIRVFPGIGGFYAFCAWIAVTLPFSLFLERSVAYVVWAMSDALIVFVFVQYFRSEREVLSLIRWSMGAYIAISLFGLVQFGLYAHGINLFVTEWWIKGRVARINGLSYEPSYFATYLIAGWVASCYLIERGAVVPGRRLQWMCLGASTAALLLSSSRMGYVMMLLWVMFRGALRLLRAFIRGLFGRSGLRFALAIGACALTLVGAALRYRARLMAIAVALPFLFSGLGVLGHSSHSAGVRIQGLQRTWRAFLHRPVLGTGIGALPVAIAAQRGRGVYDLREAKRFEGMSTAAEVIAETGIVGAALVTAIVVSVMRAYRVARVHSKPWRRLLLSAQAWGLGWMLLMLQMNQNFLRIYIFVDLAVLVCTIMLDTPTSLCAHLTHEAGLAADARVAS